MSCWLVVIDGRMDGVRAKTPLYDSRPMPRQRQTLTYFLYRLKNQGMETLSPPLPAPGLTGPLYYQLIYTLLSLLPPPLDDSPDARHVRNQAAIARVARSISSAPTGSSPATLAMAA